MDEGNANETDATKPGIVMNNQQIQELLPHRYPMLLVDKIIELIPGERVVGVKNVTINEPFFMGHFPGQPIMPGVFILESMAQVAGIMMLSLRQYQGMVPFLGGIGNVRFRHPVVPGDTLITEAWLIRSRGYVGRVRMKARVDGAVVVECDMTFTLKERVSSDYTENMPEAKNAVDNGARLSSAGGHASGRGIHHSGEIGVAYSEPIGGSTRGDGSIE